MFERVKRLKWQLAIITNDINTKEKCLNDTRNNVKGCKEDHRQDA